MVFRILYTIFIWLLENFLANNASDDYVDEKLLETYIQQIKENSNVDLVVVGYYNDYGSRKEPVSMQDKELTPSQSISYGQYSHYYGYVWNRIYKKSIIEENNLFFDQSLSYCEDHLFTYNYTFFCKSVKLLNDTLYFHRIVDNSLSVQYNIQSVIDVYHKEKSIFKKILLNSPDKEMHLVVKGIYRYRITHVLSMIYIDDNRGITPKERTLYLSSLFKIKNGTKLLDLFLSLLYKIKLSVKR